jgi:hypothetical protein
MYINMFFRNTIDWIFNYLCHPFIISDQLTAIVQREKRLTFLAGFILIISNSNIELEEMTLSFLATFILIISNIETNKIHEKSPFFRTSCRRTKTPTKDRKTKGTSPILIHSFRVWTNNFRLAVLKILATENDNFRCVRKERK